MSPNLNFLRLPIFKILQMKFRPLVSKIFLLLQAFKALESWLTYLLEKQIIYNSNLYFCRNKYCRKTFIENYEHTAFRNV